MIISFLNKRIAPYLLKHGLTLSCYLHKNKSIQKLIGKQNIDKLCLLPLTEKILSIEIHDESLKYKLDKKRQKILDYFHDQLLPGEEKEKISYKTRYELLCYYLIHKKVLLPTNQYKNILRYSNNPLFLQWLRHEYLFAYFDIDPNATNDMSNPKTTTNNATTISTKYHTQKLKMIQTLIPFVQFSSNDKLFSKYKKNVQQKGGFYFDDRTIAPTTSKLNSLFQLSSKSTTQSNNRVANQKECNELTPESIIPNTYTLEEILKLSKLNDLQNLNLLNIFCEEMKIKEIYTKEYLFKLSDYLLQRCSTFPNNDGSANVIVEVGNGSNHFLSLVLSHLFSSVTVQDTHNNTSMKSKKGNKRMDDIKIPNVISINDREWNKGKHNMQQLIHNKYKEQKQKGRNEQKLNVILICSWMSMGIDYTKHFRYYSDNIEIKEYILIGPSHPYLFSSGNDWDTWGGIDRYNEKDDVLAPYEKDGYEKMNLDFLSNLQYCKFDTYTTTGSLSRHSNTISFRKIELL